MGIRVAYGRWQDLPKEIESGVVPKDCLIVAKHRNNEAELMFYDAYGALQFVGDSRSFGSTDEAMDYLTKNPQMQGKWIAIRNDEGNYIGYMVQADNKLTELGSSADLVDLQMRFEEEVKKVTELTSKVETLEQTTVREVTVNGVKVNPTEGSVDLKVPTKVSDLQNDAKFQTAAQVDTAIKTAVASSGKAAFVKVDVLPAPQDASDGVFYLVMNEKSGHYDIYTKIGEELVWIDDTVSSLEGYLNEEQVTALVDKKMAIEQGIENAGKIMAVGPDGMVVPTDKSEFYAKKWGDLVSFPHSEKTRTLEYHVDYSCKAKKTMDFVVDIKGRGFQSGATFVHVVINDVKVASTPVRLKFEGEKSMAYLAEQFDGGNPDVNAGYTIKYLGGTKISISTEDPAKAVPFDAEYKLTGLGGHTPRQPFNTSIAPVKGSVFEASVVPGDPQFVPAVPKTAILNWKQPSPYSIEIDWGIGKDTIIFGGSGNISSKYSYPNYGQFLICLNNAVPNSLVEHPKLSGISSLVNKVVIKNSISKINSDCFVGYTALDTIVCNVKKPPVLSENVFADTKLKSIEVPAGLVAKYKAAPGWGVYKDIIHEIGTPIPGPAPTEPSI